MTPTTTGGRQRDAASATTPARSRAEFATIELVHDPSGAAVGTDSRLSHLVIQVESMDATLTELAAGGIDAEAPTSPDGTDHLQTTWIIDPDGTGSSSSSGPPVTPTA